MSSVISTIKNHDYYKAAARHYETALQKTSENTTLWGGIGVALMAIAFAMIGLSIWGVVHFFGSHAWTQLSPTDKVFVGIVIGELAIPIGAMILFSITVPLIYFGGSILYKAITHHNPKVNATDIYGDKEF